jgi:tetratricopeptide (TPR) repeat protein
MNDFVIVELIKTAFWLLLLGTVVVLFRFEIRQLLRSLSTFNVAGASFTLRDRRETIESYVLLSETFIELLSRSDRIEELTGFMLPSQIERLGAFALRYTEEVGDGIWNEELLRNVALLLLRSGRYLQAVRLYDALLKRRPDHLDLLNLKALALLVSRTPEMVQQSFDVLEPLAGRYPENQAVRFNLALAKSLLSNHDGAFDDLERLVVNEYQRVMPKFLNDPLLHRTRVAYPDRLAALASRASGSLTK